MSGDGRALSKPHGDTAVLELPAGVVSGLEREARRARKPVAALLANVLEDIADARAADAALKRHLDSGKKPLSSAAVKKRLGLAA
jgi:hypothetical protein